MADEYVAAQHTMSLHPGSIAAGDAPPVNNPPETVPLTVNEPERPLLRPYIDSDPHGIALKGEGGLHKKTQFFDPKIEYREYPKVLYKQSEGTVARVTVNSDDELNKATTEGFSPDATPASAPNLEGSRRIVSMQVQYLNEAGEVVAYSEPQQITQVPAVGLIDVPAPGSGTGRWGDHRVWTEAGDGTDYPTGSYGVKEASGYVPGVGSDGEPLKPFEPLPDDAPVAQTVPVQE